MKCIFCGNDSSQSISVEHIIPESFGNSKAILRKGIVCDKCNNYFSRKVEGPFLNSKEIKMIRQEFHLKSKRNKLINEYDIFKDNIIIRALTNGRYLIYGPKDLTHQEGVTQLKKYLENIFEDDKILLHENQTTSRLLAKIAIEYFVFICGSSDEVCEYVSTDEYFKELRNYARLGTGAIWPYHCRRVYGRNANGVYGPFPFVCWEADLLFTNQGEIYLIIIMFGIEYAINLGRPTINGYKKWLKSHKNKCFLYFTPKEREHQFNQYISKMSKTDKIWRLEFKSIQLGHKD